jgi:protein gp37
MSKSSIEWTEHTWNPIVGCSIVSPGCTNCYAMQMAARIEAMGNQPRYAGTTRKVNGNAVWTGKLAQAPEATLLAPLKRKKPTTYFVNSMGDLFHEDCPDEWIDRVFAVMALSPQHTFQVLTKRAARMREYFDPRGPGAAKRISRIAPNALIKLPLPNVWLGISAERQQEWDERKEHLRATPAAVSFASFEPLLGAIVEPRPMSDYLQWAIVGGESGHSARPMHPDWARSLRDQCQTADVPFFMKQLSGLHGRAIKDMAVFPEDLRIRRMPNAA